MSMIIVLKHVNPMKKNFNVTFNNDMIKVFINSKLFNFTKPQSKLNLIDSTKSLIQLNFILNFPLWY